MGYTKKEKGSRLVFRDMISISHVRFIWKELLEFLEKEIYTVDISEFKDSQYLKLIKLKIARNLIKFKSTLLIDNVKSLTYLSIVGQLASIFSEYVYFYKKGRRLPRKDLNL